MYIRGLSRFLLGTIFVLTFHLSATQKSLAKENIYKSSQFLEFSEGQRDWFYNGAFMAIGHVVSTQDQQQGKCVWDWYFKNTANRIPLIEGAMKSYPDHSPTAIFIGLLEKDCGKFKR